jgi:oligoribonuclease (3'-5' exoribonuclease)
MSYVMEKLRTYRSHRNCGLCGNSVEQAQRFSARTLAGLRGAVPLVLFFEADARELAAEYLQRPSRNFNERLSVLRTASTEI